MIEQWLLSLSVVVLYFVFGAIIFAESGLFFGFFLPGDSLLFSLGLFAAAGNINIWVLILIGIPCAILGDNVGYAFGRTVGPKIFKEKRRFLNLDHLNKAKLFYDKYGTKTVFLARFVPFARTFAPILAGVSEMKYPLFFIYNVVGGITWVGSILALGYFLGKVIPGVDQYILPIIALIVIVSVIPAALGYLKEKNKTPSES